MATGADEPRCVSVAGIGGSMEHFDTWTEGVYDCLLEWGCIEVQRSAWIHRRFRLWTACYDDLLIDIHEGCFFPEYAEFCRANRKHDPTLVAELCNLADAMRRFESHAKEFKNGLVDDHGIIDHELLLASPYWHSVCARARSVAALLKPHVQHPTRVESNLRLEGFAESCIP